MFQVMLENNGLQERGNKFLSLDNILRMKSL